MLEAGRTALAAGDKSALVRAAIAIPQFGAVGFVDPMPESRSLTEAALEAVGDQASPERASLLMDLASHWLFVNVDEALDLARRAESVARDLAEPAVLGPCCSPPATCSATRAASTSESESAPSSSRSVVNSIAWR